MKLNLKWRGFMSTTEYCLCMDLYGGNYNLVCSQSDVANILQLNIHVACSIKARYMYI